MKLVSSIKDWLDPHISSPSELGVNEEVALKNIIEVAKERVWLADPTSAIEYNDYHQGSFSADLTTETVDRIKSSIKLMDSYLLKNSSKKKG
jgi:hypothetical protein